MNVNTISMAGPLSLKANQALPFRAQEKTENNSAPKEEKKRSLTAKKWGVGLASASHPGLGQLINGQFGRACGFFFTFGGFVALAGVGFAKGIKSLNLVESEKAAGKNINKLSDKLNLNKKSFSKTGKALMAIGYIGALVTYIYGIVDAVKQTKRDRV